MSESILRLFKAILITKKGKGKISKAVLKATIQKGFIFSPEVALNYTEKELLNLVDTISKEVGLSGEQMNNSLHKSWKKVKEANIEDLVIEQILHYITTYGFEAMGIYNKDSVYIPFEKLSIPKINVEKISLVVIKGYTKEELKSKLINLLGTGIALSEDTKKDVIDVATFVEFTEKEIHEIKNKEVKCSLYDFLGTFPKDPVEFLRFMIYKSTNSTLIIKNKITINEIKSKDNLSILALLTRYEKKYRLEKLAEVFFRFKPLFLAFRTSQKLKSVINKIRKLADKYHKPMKEDFLNNVTSKISNGLELTKKELNEELGKVNTFRKIRLAYSLKYRTSNSNSILYRIRNGKSYATEFNFDKKDKAQKVLDIVLNSIIKDVEKNVKGKKIYLPNNINYALPTTEKQFTGDIPSGSYISVPKDMIIGVHWENMKEVRVDLDLSMMNVSVGKIGWDSYYRTDDRSILFSGDVTDAPLPKGASEFFYVKKQEDSAFIIMLNYYNGGYNYDGEGEAECPFKIIVGSQPLTNLPHNYVIDPNKVVSVVKSKINKSQRMLGLLVTTPKECRFYFTETNIGNSITSYGNDYIEHARKFMIDYYQNSISFNDILLKAGAVFVADEKKCDINLSPEVIEKDSILNLVKNN